MSGFPFQTRICDYPKEVILHQKASDMMKATNLWLQCETQQMKYSRDVKLTMTVPLSG
jgi:hypothetical protein